MGIPLHPGQSVENLKSDLGGSVEQSYVTIPSIGTGSFESFVATFPDTASAAQADYLHFVEPSGTSYACWLDIDAAGTTPTGAIYVAADEKITLGIATGDTSAQVAAKVKAAIDLNGTFAEYAIVDNSDGTLTFTANILGNPADAAPHNAGDTGAGTISVEVTSGSAASSQDTYFQVRDDDTGLFHVWLNVNGEGVDPNPGGGSVGIEVAVDAADSIATVASAIATAVNANAEFEAEVVSNGRIKITTATKASVVDLVAGDSGFTVAVSTQGSGQKISPSMSPSNISNNPSAF